MNKETLSATMWKIFDTLDNMEFVSYEENINYGHVNEAVDRLLEPWDYDEME